MSRGEPRPIPEPVQKTDLDKELVKWEATKKLAKRINDQKVPGGEIQYIDGAPIDPEGNIQINQHNMEIVGKMKTMMRRASKRLEATWRTAMAREKRVIARSHPPTTVEDMAKTNCEKFKDAQLEAEGEFESYVNDWLEIQSRIQIGKQDRDELNSQLMKYGERYAVYKKDMLKKMPAYKKPQGA